MDSAGESGPDQVPEVPCLVPTLGEGTSPLYEGPLRITGSERTFDGVLLLSRGKDPQISAEFRGEASAFEELFWASKDGEYFFPDGVTFKLPSEIHEPDTNVHPGYSGTYSLSSITGGDPSRADQFLVSVSSYLTPPLPMATTPGGRQRQTRFSLPGWEIVLALVSSRTSKEPEIVVAAMPGDGRTREERSLKDLSLHLFYLLGFLFSVEPGIGPTFGLTQEGGVSWVSLTTGRKRANQTAFRWCPKDQMSDALVQISAGYGRILDDPALTKVVNRSIEAFMFANSREVLDVRIPIVGTALETLAWAYLRREKKKSHGEVRRMSLGTKIRALVEEASIRTDIPEEFPALRDRQQRLDYLKDGEAPEVLASVRNGLVHPPNDAEDPEWPSEDELWETWLMTTWYLELVLMNWLRYDGLYILRSGFQNRKFDEEPVPWSGHDDHWLDRIISKPSEDR